MQITSEKMPTLSIGGLPATYSDQPNPGQNLYVQPETRSCQASEICLTLTEIPALILLGFGDLIIW